jgi:hypothetical protein
MIRILWNLVKLQNCAATVKVRSSKYTARRLAVTDEHRMGDATRAHLPTLLYTEEFFVSH